MFEPFGEYLEELSDGRIVVESYSADALVPCGEMLEALRQGTLDIAFCEGGMWGATIPVGDIETLTAFIARDYKHVQALYEDRLDYESLPFGFGLKNICRDQYLEKENIYYIQNIYTDSSVLWLNEPIKTFDDLDGMKLWIWPIVARALEPSGAVLSTVPAEELYSAKASGIVNGSMWGGTACGWDMGWHEIMGYILRPAFQTTAPNAYLMAPEAWHALPDDLKTMVQAAVIYDSDFMVAAYTYRDIAKQKVMEEEYGLEVLTLPQEEWDKWAQWCVDVLEEMKVENEENREAVDLVLEWMKFFDYID